MAELAKDVGVFIKEMAKMAHMYEPEARAAAQNLAELAAKGAFGLTGISLLTIGIMPVELAPITIFLSPAIYAAMYEQLRGTEYFLLGAGIAINYKIFWRQLKHLTGQDE